MKPGKPFTRTVCLDESLTGDIMLMICKWYHCKYIIALAHSSSVGLKLPFTAPTK